MAEAGSWPSIQERGLLSAEKLCQLFEVPSEATAKLLSEHRPESVELCHEKYGRVVIRDQKPMSVGGLTKALVDIAPQEWLRLLNSKVYFWPTEERLGRMINARAYKGKEHDIIVIDSLKLLHPYAEKAWLCHLNSGCTTPYAHPRDRTAFKRLSEYPLEERRKKYGIANAVAEIAIDDGVPDIKEAVIKVVPMKGWKPELLM